jgi:hypothetical protein
LQIKIFFGKIGWGGETSLGTGQKEEERDKQVGRGRRRKGGKLSP